MSKQLIKGLHHVTAMASSPQGNVDFYVGILGLRLVKKTINFDAPDVYHLYYGDETGSAGSIMTFFPFSNMQPGRHGYGQAATTTFSVPKSSIDYWLKRFDHFKVKYKAPQDRFNDVVVYFEDFDGLGLELIFNDNDDRVPFTYGHIPLEHSIRGFYSVEIWEPTYEKTESLLVNQLDHEFIKESGSRRRYAPKGAKPGQILDIVWQSPGQYGMPGSGTVHHIAFDVANDAEQLEVRDRIIQGGFSPTPVIDRQYFHSIYFREPGGVLFEVATTPPGFLYDEPIDKLGESLKLPQWEEKRRDYIESLLEPIVLKPENYASPS